MHHTVSVSELTLNKQMHFSHPIKTDLAKPQMWMVFLVSCISACFSCA